MIPLSDPNTTLEPSISTVFELRLLFLAVHS